MTERVVPMDQTREVQMAEMCGLKWNSASHGHDAQDAAENFYEFKSTSTNKEFSTARDLNISTIERYMNCYWIFAFYNGKGDDVIDRMFLCHPDALRPKFDEWLRKMGDAKYYCDMVWQHALVSMEEHRLPASMISHYKKEIDKIFNRGGQTLAGPSIPKGMIYRSVDNGFGIEFNLNESVPEQRMNFVQANPLKVARPKVL